MFMFMFIFSLASRRASSLTNIVCPALPLSLFWREQDAAQYVSMLCSSDRPDLFVSMNEQIIKNLSIGIYDGCKVAVELAAELARL